MNEKSLLVNCTTYGSIQQKDSNCIRSDQKNKSSKICWNLLWITIILMTLMFLTGCFLNFYTPYKYDKIFESIEIRSRYDLNSYLPVVDFHLKKQKILIETKLNRNKSETTHQKSSNYFELIKHVFESIQSNYRLDTAKNDYFKLNTRKFKFSINKISTYDDDVECFNLSMSKQIKRLRDLETCVYLGDHYWFGGHESLVSFYIFYVFIRKFQAI
jgi:hypothetical protein